MIRNINPNLGMNVTFENVEEMLAALHSLDALNPLDEGESWVPEDGLIEGRDYEIIEGARK